MTGGAPPVPRQKIRLTNMVGEAAVKGVEKAVLGQTMFTFLVRIVSVFFINLKNVQDI